MTETLSSLGAPIALHGVAFSPFVAEFRATITDDDDLPVLASAGTVAVYAGKATVATDDYAPNVAVTADGNVSVFTIAWDADTTGAMIDQGQLRYQLNATIDGGGPYPLAASSVKFSRPGTAGASTTASIDLTVPWGIAGSISFSIRLGGGGTVGGGGATNLAYTASPTQGVVTSDTGTDATIPAATGVNAGLLLPADFTQLAGLVAALAGKQPLDTDLTAIAALVSAADKMPYATGAGTWSLADLSAFARTILDDANAAAVIATLGLAALYQPLDTELTALAGLTSAADKGIQFTGSGTAGTFDLTTFAKTILDDANAAAVIATLGLAALYQPLDATLTALAALVTAADKLVYATGSDTFTTTDLTSFARTLLDDANASTARGTLGLGTADSPEFTAVNIGHATDTTVSRASAGDIAVEGNRVFRVGGSTVGLPETLIVPIGDETTALTTGTAKVTFRMPFAMTVTTVRASLTTVSSSGNPTFDINEGGTSILGTKLSVDANEKTSTTAASAATITDSALADDAEITIDIDTAGTGAAGAKIYIVGTRA